MPIVVILASYLLGSIPTGLLLARAAGGPDIRKTGSGNIGATNVYRTAGRKLGILTLVGDCLKGLIPVVAARRLGLDPSIVALAGVAAFCGHVYNVFLGFKGGKGVATALGVFIALSPAAIGVALAAFVGCVWKWRYISLGSVVAAVVMPFAAFGLTQSVTITTAAAVIAGIVVWRHRENIQRLRQGTENRFNL